MSAAASATPAVDVAIGVTWLVFWIYWLGASVRTKATRARPSSLLPVRIAVIVLILLLVHGGVFRGHGATVHDPSLQAAGAALFAAGLGLAVWARVHLGRNWGTPMSQKESPELVTSGPYRRIRHPIYSGIILGMIGTALAVSLYWLAAVVVLGGYFVYSAFVEERAMVGEFPDAYAAYRRTSKMFVPYVF